MELASGSGHEDQVEDQNFRGRTKETCDHCGRGPSVIANRLTSTEDELAAFRKLLKTKPRRRSKCVSFSVRSSKKRIQKAFDVFPLSHSVHVDDVHDGSSSPLPDQVADASYKTISLTDHAHVHNDDGPSSHLPDQVEDASYKTLPSSPLHVQVNNASCKTLPDEVTDSAVDNEDRSPDGRIIDVLAHIHGEYDIEVFGDAAQNDYETANEEVV
ncbi:hypothetical protein K7X08_036091 [Anisodus acutangulus]|uniref:Uncharacterized protein n=1 Tax=Anisodus acutangulus TaxID=402998 RepID=A0A9Q1QVX6_9SOLA|nr:hypothetical protein K7X08_036091 [Anisodus acutangulus]